MANDKKISFNLKELEEAYTKNLFLQEEHEKFHYQYELETEEMGYIEKGDLQSFLNYKDASHGDYHLSTISSDILTNAKYLSILNIALSSRAAIRGGVPEEQAFAMADACYRMIDALELSQLYSFQETVRGMQVAFLNMVAENHGKKPYRFDSRNVTVSKAKNYIYTHLHGRITLEDVAREAGTHPNHLNRLFKESDGITIHEYILKEKVKLAQNMLKYSGYSYVDIANYLGFTSQSHLGQVFKRHTGMTLKQYRDSNRDFAFVNTVSEQSRN